MVPLASRVAKTFLVIVPVLLGLAALAVAWRAP